MNISLKTNLPPGPASAGADSERLHATTKKGAKAGVALEELSKYMGVGGDNPLAGHRKTLIGALLPEPAKGGSLGDALDKLSDSAVVLGDIYALMAVFQQLAQLMRDQAREMRNSEMQGQVSSLMASAKEIRAAAKDRAAAGTAQGVLQMTAGIVVAGFGVASGVFGVKSGLADGPTTALGKRWDGVGAILSSVGQGGGQAVSGIGTTTSAGVEQAAAGHDAKRAEREADAKVRDQGVQHANELMQQMMDIIRDLREKYASVQQSNSDTNRAIYRNL
ncbi:type III secretion system translocon subunit SctB [Alcaligenes sp. WGS1538]|uniref:type III secretion system translocon subunit SctB n=1 Tax=Alcaligenes sp. WGS1538 TaxID=3366811 RepID=UPI00372D45B1